MRLHAVACMPQSAEMEEQQFGTVPMSDHDNVRANAQLMCEREEAHEHAQLHAGTSSRRHYPSQELPETFQEHLVPVAVAQRAEED